MPLAACEGLGQTTQLCRLGSALLHVRLAPVQPGSNAFDVLCTVCVAADNHGAPVPLQVLESVTPPELLDAVQLLDLYGINDTSLNDVRPETHW